MFFSVIVPIYKVESYLSECVDSILSQSFGDFELILVDDGSPDGCPAICDDYAKRDERVKVIHKKNGGLVSARKAGVSAAKGDFIINVDGDDWLREGYFDEARKIIEKYNPDIITFAADFVTDGKGETDPEFIPEGLYTEKDIEREIYPRLLLTKDMKHMHYFLWAKVFRRELITRHQLEMDERISMGEDIFCLVPTYMDAKSVYVSSFSCYNVRCHSDSMSRKFNPYHFNDIAIGVGILRRNVDENHLYMHEYIDRYTAFICFVLVASAAASGKRDDVKTIKSLWTDEFEQSFARAKFEGITAKSKIAVALLKKKKITAAFDFLKICEKIKK